MKTKKTAPKQRKEDEEHIINDMGMMVEFFKKEQEKNNVWKHWDGKKKQCVF